MLKIREISTTVSKTFLLALALGLIATSGANGTEIDGSCRTPVPVLANETLRSDGADPGENRCFVIDLAAPGILTLDVSAPGAERANARLDFLGPAGGTRIERKVFEYVKRSATSVTLAVRAGGSYLVRVAAEDRRLGLPPYKLRAGFGEEGGLALKGEYDEELEPDPDPLVWPPLKSEVDEELEPDPDPLISCTSAHDLAAAPAALRSELQGLCRTGEVDDHGDSFACATVLRHGGSATGEIHNGWGDDEDVYRFRLAEQRTVEITSDGFTDTVGELYDSSGNRLDRDDEGGEGGNFRLVRSLSPGVYFVRVSGRNADRGSYSLAVRALP